ncbi:TetR/AcrR family transcriptional regulator [Novosphingobium sp. ST904]|uniref:TetR/AcrR family transcriptional regulator n=2 Tax=Novosphingobium sp. ST904 TaxID=1684385 RepID=UPI0006C8BE57|nr:TetR/AcrR family transcriptional regulator [Novosphingobium sp. ST904]
MALLVGDKRDATKNHARKRRKILEIAGRHFLDHGYAAATMSAIASELGGSKTTLWDHFPSKQDLLQAFLLDATSSICAISLYDVAGDCTPNEAIQATAEHLVARLTSERAIGLQRLVNAEAGRIEGLGRRFSNCLFQGIKPQLTEFFDAHLERNSRRSGDADAAAAMLLTLCLNVGQERLLWAIEPPSGALAKERAEQVASLMRLYPMSEGPRRSQ